MQLKLVWIKRENIQVHHQITGKRKGDCEAHNRSSIAVDSEPFQGCMQRELFSRVSLDQNPANYNCQSEVNITNQWEIQLKQRQVPSKEKRRKKEWLILTFQFTKPDVDSQATDSYKKALATTPYTNPIQNFN